MRILGSWMGEKEDVRNRIKRAGMLWGNVKGWLRGLNYLRGGRGRLFRHV